MKQKTFQDAEYFKSIFLTMECFENFETSTTDEKYKRMKICFENIKSKSDKIIIKYSHFPELIMMKENIKYLNNKNINKIKLKLYEYLYFYYLNEILNEIETIKIMDMIDNMNKIEVFFQNSLNLMENIEFYNKESLINELIYIELNILKYY